MARIKVREWAESEGLVPKGDTRKLSEIPEFMETVESCVRDCVAPAMCDEGCEVEPDGRCEHGAPSLLLACGLM